MEPICPACRHKDQTCKVRFLENHPFFSCLSCYEVEERRQRSKPRDLDPLDRMGYRPSEPQLHER